MDKLEKFTRTVGYILSLIIIFALCVLIIIGIVALADKIILWAIS